KAGSSGPLLPVMPIATRVAPAMGCGVSPRFRTALHAASTCSAVASAFIRMSTIGTYHDAGPRRTGEPAPSSDFAAAPSGGVPPSSTLAPSFTFARPAFVGSAVRGSASVGCMPPPFLATPARPVFVIDAVRTPVGRYGGALSSVRPDDLAAHVVAAAVDRARVPAAEIEDVYFGCANQAGGGNRNVARMAAPLADLPDSGAGVPVHRLCASGLSAIVQASHAVVAGDGDLFVAGGVESMSRAPLVMAKPEHAFPRGNHTVWDTTLGWRFPNPRMLTMFPLESMGETGENVAERWKVTREE